VTNRDLPTPAGPIKVNRRLVRDAAASEKSAASRSSSRWRPTIGRSRWRATPTAAASRAIRRYAVTGFGLPVRDSSNGSVITASRTRLTVVSPSSWSGRGCGCWSGIGDAGLGIDIVAAEAGEKGVTLVFCEVKCRSGTGSAIRWRRSPSARCGRCANSPPCGCASITSPHRLSGWMRSVSFWLLASRHLWLRHPIVR
jgi:hypothetical protein